MQNKIQNLILVVSSLVISGLFFVTPAKAQAYVDLDVNAHEAPNVYQLSGKDYTDNPSSTVYGRSINAKAGDTIKLQLHYHNFTAGQVASNVQMAVSVPSAAGTSFTINSSLWAGNSIRTYSDSMTITLSSSQTLQFVPGSVVWYPGFNGMSTLPNGQSGDTVVSSGVNVGNVDPGNSASGYVYLNLVVSNTSVTPTPSGSAPVASTNSATGISQNSATLNGSVNPNGASTNTWFEYGTSNSLGSQTSSQSIGSGTSNINTNTYIFGLSSNTTYYFRAVAQNSYGTSYGSILSFTTNSSGGSVGSSPIASTNSATGISQTSATLNGSANPNGADTNIWFEYGSTFSLGSQTTLQNIGSGTSNSNINTNISGLSQNTTYYFRAVAQNSYGTSYGSILSFTTLVGTSGSAPIVSTNSATNINTTWATLNGSVNPNGSSANYWFEYGTTNSFGNSTSQNSAGSGTSNTNVSRDISGLSSNTTYYFRAVAQNSYGTTYGSTLSFTTTGVSGYAPVASTNSATGISQNSATLNGSVNPNGASTNTWFEYGTSNSLGSQTSSQSIGSGTSNSNINTNISGLSQNTTYYFRAVAQNSYGTSYGSILSFTTNSSGGGTICTPTVTTSSVSFITENSASLLGYIYPNGYTTDAWFEYGTNNNLGTRTSYQTFYTSSGPDLIRYISSLSPNTVYYYRAAAQNSCGTSYGSTLSFNTTGSTNLPVVNTLLASNVGLSYATLNGSVNPGNSDATSWFEYGTDPYLNTYNTTSSANTGSGNYLMSMASPVTGLSSNTTYYFRAVARNNMGTVKGAISNFKTELYTSTDTNTAYGSLSVWKEVKNLTFPNGTQYVNAASIGDVIEYALNVKNVGSASIGSVTVKDAVSSYYDIVEANPNYASNDGGTLTWNLGSISPNENRIIYLKVKARTVEQSVVVYNSFTATSGSTKTSNKTTTILNPSMMAIDIAADKGVVDRNGTFSYNIRYRNIGINDVDNVVIKVSMPESIRFISSNPAQSSSDANVYFYRIGRVAKNQFGAISIQARVNEDAEVGTRQIATAVLDYNDIFGTPQRNISVSSAVDVGSGFASLAAGVGFSFGGNWWMYLLWALIILLVLAIVYLYFRISRLLKNNY